MNTCVERRLSLECCLGFIGKGISAIAMDYSDLLRVASSFAPPPVENALSRSVHNRLRRRVPALMAVSGATGPVRGNPVRNAACKALSTFSPCNDNTGLKNTVRILMQQQENFAQNVHRVQESNDEKFSFWAPKLLRLRRAFTPCEM